MSANRVPLVLLVALTVSEAAGLGDAVTFAIGPEVKQNQSNAAAQPNEPDIERLIQDLVSEDAKAADAAREQLHRMPHAVPVLFERLVEADWDLKPPLLEVLARVEGGRDYARLKLLHGTEAEITYAALLYELIDLDEDTKSSEYVVMVEVLLNALKSEDKNLRAAAALALVHDEPHRLMFEHLHKVVPAMISSFDTPLVIDRGPHDPSGEVFLGICAFLDAFIGDRLAYVDVQPTLSKNAEMLGVAPGLSPQRKTVEFLARNREEIEKLRGYWQNWWDKHATMSAIELGKLIIERNLRFIPETKPTHRETMKWPLAPSQA